MTHSTQVSVRVWDLPTRVFHWALVVCVVGAYVTVKLGGLWMDWHVRFGLATFGLILFRIVWGLVGPHYARFGHFFRGPRHVWRYVRGQEAHIAGHNPLGSWSVIAMLLAFGFQATSGLFADDDIFTSGPLAWLSSTWSARLTGLHKLNEWLLLGLVVLHIGVITWYGTVRRRGLVKAMITGNAQLDRRSAQGVPNTTDSASVRLGALLLALAIAFFVWWITTLAPSAASFY